MPTRPNEPKVKIAEKEGLEKISARKAKELAMLCAVAEANIADISRIIEKANESVKLVKMVVGHYEIFSEGFGIVIEGIRASKAKDALQSDLSKLEDLASGLEALKMYQEDLVIKTAVQVVSKWLKSPKSEREKTKEGLTTLLSKKKNEFSQYAASLSHSILQLEQLIKNYGADKKKLERSGTGQTQEEKTNIAKIVVERMSMLGNAATYAAEKDDVSDAMKFGRETRMVITCAGDLVKRMNESAKSMAESLEEDNAADVNAEIITFQFLSEEAGTYKMWVEADLMSDSAKGIEIVMNSNDAERLAGIKEAQEVISDIRLVLEQGIDFYRIAESEIDRFMAELERKQMLIKRKELARMN